MAFIHADIKGYYDDLYMTGLLRMECVTHLIVCLSIFRVGFRHLRSSATNEITIRASARRAREILYSLVLNPSLR